MHDIESHLRGVIASDIIKGEGKKAFTRHPVPNTSTERLIQEHRFDGCFPLQDPRCEIFEGRHRQNRVETKFRNRWFVQRFCTEPDATQASDIQKRELKGLRILIVWINEMQYELDGC